MEWLLRMIHQVMDRYGIICPEIILPPGVGISDEMRTKTQFLPSKEPVAVVHGNFAQNMERS